MSETPGHYFAFDSEGNVVPANQLSQSDLAQVSADLKTRAVGELALPIPNRDNAEFSALYDQVTGIVDGEVSPEGEN